MSGSEYWTKFWAKRVSRRRLLKAGTLTAAGLGAAALVGCGDDDDGATSTAAPTGTPGAGTATATPKLGGNLSFPEPYGETPHLDVHQTTTGILHERGPGLAYSRLFKFQMGKDVPEGAFLPEGDLVLDFEQPDEVTYLLNLRPNAMFHDIAPVNGRPVTAEDVVYSFGRQVELKVNASYVSGAAYQAVDQQILQATLESPNVDFLVGLASHPNKIVAREVVEQYGDLKEAPVIGSGAWIHEEWVPGSVVRFRKNPDYFLPGLPYADTLTITRILEPTTYAAAFETGAIDVMFYTAAGGHALIDPVVSSVEGARVFSQRAQATGGTTLKPRGDQDPTNNISVRQALSKVINRQEVIDAIYSGNGYLTAGILPPADDWLLPEDEIAQLLAVDVESATQLLQAAGVSDLAPTMKAFAGPAWQDMAQLLQSQLLAIDVNATIESCDSACIGASIAERNFEMLLSPDGVGGGTTSDLNTRFRSGASRNPTGVVDDELDQLIDAQAREQDEDRRRDLFNQIQRRVIESAAHIPVGNGTSPYVVQPYLMDYFPPPYGESTYYDRLWLDR